MLAIETLSWIELQKLSERLALIKTTNQLNIRDADSVKFANRLVYETLRRKNLIDKFINNTLKRQEKTISELNMGVQAFLRLYVYQTHVTKNWTRVDLEEAQRIAKLGRSILGWQTLREVEPILGVLLTQKLEPILEALTDEQTVALKTFHPTWFVKYCYRLFGRGEAIAFLEGSINPPPPYIRLNTLKDSVDKILEKLASEGVEVRKVELLRNAYLVTGGQHKLATTNSAREGLFYVQDKASCYAVEAANPKPSMTVFDVCAAPGAKTTYIAQLMENQGSIYSVDYSRRRMQDWTQEIPYMGVKIAEPVIADARSPLPLNGEADLVFLDPPCSSTGVFAKQPSAKWRLRLKSIEKMVELQWQMIDNCAQKVKSSGVLTYSTCSITVEENEMIIERFLKWHPEFSLAEISPKIGLPGLRGLTRCQRLYPHLHQCNGFFIAKLQKE